MWDQLMKEIRERDEREFAEEASGGVDLMEKADEFPDRSADVHCPYCGEPSELLLDPGGAGEQEYVEDCEVCCRPWTVRVRWSGGFADVSVRREDEAVY